MSTPLEVVLCMGSSCFSRGNATNLEAVRRHLAASGAELRLDLRGHLCEGRCGEGPHLLVDGQLHSHVTPGAVRALLERHLAARRRAAAPPGAAGSPNDERSPATEEAQAPVASGGATGEDCGPRERLRGEGP